MPNHHLSCDSEKAKQNNLQKCVFESYVEFLNGLPPCFCLCIWGEGTLLTCGTWCSRGAGWSSLVGDKVLERYFDRCLRLWRGGGGQLGGAPSLPATPADCVCCPSVASMKHCEVSAARPCRRAFAVALSGRSWCCLCLAAFLRRFLHCGCSDPLAVCPVIIFCRLWAGGREILLFPAQIPVCDAVCRLAAHHLSS